MFLSGIVTLSPNFPTSMRFMVVSILVESLFTASADKFVLPGSPWGAGTFAAANGSRQPSKLELEIATIQGKAFWGTVSKVKF